MMTDTAGTRTRDRSDDEPWVVAGVDTHKDTHHVAAGSAATGAGLGDMRVPATPAGYDQPRDFVRSHGRIRMIGIEGTGSYGAGPARALRAAGAPTPGVIRPKRSQRRRGKSDPIDAYAAAGRALARGRRPARGQDRHRPLRTDPGAPGLAPQRDEGPRPSPTGRSPPCRPPPPTPCAPASPASAARGLTDALARTRPAPATHRPRIGDRASAAPPGPPPPDPDRRDRRHRHRAARTDRPRRPDDARHQGAAPSTTATLLAGAGDNPGRIRTEASFAALCGAAPIPASSGKTNRHRLNRGGDRQANREPHPNAPPARRPAHQGPRRPPHRHGQELQRDTAPPPNAPSPAKHGTRRPTPNPHPAPTTCAEGATNEDSPPAQAAHHLNTHPARISELERGTRPDTTLTAAYRQWLNTQQPQTHTA